MGDEYLVTQEQPSLWTKNKRTIICLIAALISVMLIFVVA